MLSSIVQSEIQAEDFRIPGGQGAEGSIDLLDKQLIHDLHVRIALFIGDEAVAERPLSLALDRSIQPDIGRVESGKGLDHFHRKPRCIGDLLRGRLPLQLFAQRFRAADNA
jgi:hypothetical protein